MRPAAATRLTHNRRMPRAIIADDERLMREQLRTRLTEVWPELEIVAEAKNGEEAIAAVANSSLPTWLSSTSACPA